MWKQSDGSFVSHLRPHTFRLQLAGRIELDWMKHRSYLVRTVPPPSGTSDGKARSPTEPEEG
jgi:hypothetical protein